LLVNAHEFSPLPEKTPPTQPAVSGGPPDPPPRPPKLTQRDLLDPGDATPRLFLEQYTEVGELAQRLHLKPFQLVAELLRGKIFKHADELIDFPTAAALVNRHGFIAERLF
jgi:hypothetical protein